MVAHHGLATDEAGKQARTGESDRRLLAVDRRHPNEFRTESQPQRLVPEADPQQGQAAEYRALHHADDPRPRRVRGPRTDHHQVDPVERSQIAGYLATRTQHNVLAVDGQSIHHVQAERIMVFDKQHAHVVMGAQTRRRSKREDRLLRKTCARSTWASRPLLSRHPGRAGRQGGIPGGVFVDSRLEAQRSESLRHRAWNGDGGRLLAALAESLDA